jgi:membrane fusion protein (multidrug efflux system)
MVACRLRSSFLIAAALLTGCGSGGAKDEGGGPPPPVVTVVEVRTDPVTRSIEGVADVAAAEAVVLTAKFAGRVAEVLFREGERVARGQPLVRLDAEQEAAEVAVLRAGADELRGQIERRAVLAEEGALPRGEVEDLRRQLRAAEARTQSARAVLQDTVVRAPFAGTVGLRDLSPGALVQPGDEIATLDNIDSVRLRFTVPERDIGRLRIGSAVEARSPAFPDRVFRGRLASFDSRLDPEQRTLAVEARLPNPDRLLRPGMLANIRIDAETNADAMVVPAQAVQARGDTQFVYRIVGGCAERVAIAIGQREPDRIEVLRGLRPGDRIAVEGLQNLSGGEAVTVKGERPRGQGAEAGEKAGEKPEPRCPAERRQQQNDV